VDGEAYKVWIPRLILDPDLVELDIEELIDTLEDTGYAEIILELYRHLYPSISLLRLPSVYSVRVGGGKPSEIYCSSSRPGASDLTDEDLALRLRMTCGVLIIGRWERGTYFVVDEGLEETVHVQTRLVHEEKGVCWLRNRMDYLKKSMAMAAR